MGPDEVGRLVSCAVDVYMLSSAYLISFTGSCVIAACYEFIMCYIDTWLYIDLLITRKQTVAVVIIFKIRVISFDKNQTTCFRKQNQIANDSLIVRDISHIETPTYSL